jgi:2-polyprenyl-3-methyl-5-hydroxy-6-metoxy-1,4-benzoquinol methylase
MGRPAYRAVDGDDQLRGLPFEKSTRAPSQDGASKLLQNIIRLGRRSCRPDRSVALIDRGGTLRCTGPGQDGVKYHRNSDEMHVARDVLRFSVRLGSRVANDTYIFGRSEGELQRLAQQAALVEPETEELFLRSGIGAGMHVLEIGSGAGDVAMLAGRLVRPNGSVLGVERSADSVGLATDRVAAAANVKVRFKVGDINSYQPSASYDALVGRFVLPYLNNPPAVLRRLASHVRPGGVIAFIEFDVTRIGSVPEAPLFHAMASWIATLSGAVA